MARHQRPIPQPAAGSHAPQNRTSSRQAPRASRPDEAGRDGAPARSTYTEAIRHFEQAVRALQMRDYGSAAEQLRELRERFPEEKELQDRVRLYLAICERHLQPPPPEPCTTHERLLAATLAVNAGEAARAITLLDQVCRDDPGNDQALYLLAVAHGLNGEPHRAVPFLERAIQMDAGNRARARVDPDLEPLRAAGLAAVFDGPAESRSSSRPRGSR